MGAAFRSEKERQQMAAVERPDRQHIEEMHLHQHRSHPEKERLSRDRVERPTDQRACDPEIGTENPDERIVRGGLALMLAHRDPTDKRYQDNRGHGYPFDERRDRVTALVN